MGYDEGVLEMSEGQFRDLIIGAAFQALIGSTKDMIFVKDAKLKYVAASLPFAKMAGKESVEDIIGKTDDEIFEPALAKRYVADDIKLLSKGEDLKDYTEPILGENGKARYATTSKYILRDSQGTPIGLVGITKDITQFYITRQRYHQELKYLFELPEDTYAVSYIDVDAWRVITQRRQEIGEGTLPACLSIEELAEAAVEAIVDKENEAVTFYQNFTRENLLEIFNSGRISFSFEYERRMTDGSVRWVKNNVKFMTDVDSGHLCAMLFAKDIDEQKKEEAELVFAAKMDKMTMVLNRETSMEYIRETLEENGDKKHVLFMTDIDNFKNLNDTLGHQKGDEFLVVLAKAIKNCFRETDIVGRIGGDEFFAFMKNTGATSTVEKKAKEMLSVMRKVCANYPGMDMSGSIGVSIYPDHGTTLEELYAKADVALYQAKRTGKDKYVFYKE